LAEVILRDPRRDKDQARAEAIADYQAAWHLRPDGLEIQRRLRDLEKSGAETQREPSEKLHAIH